jgi:hypothetical protein
LIVATATFDDVQATEPVMLAVLPSVYVPVAVNWSVTPFATLGFTGATAIDVRAAAVTVSVVVPLTEPDVAVIVEDPIAKVEARPDASIVATTTFDDVQATEPVMLAVLPSV